MREGATTYKSQLCFDGNTGFLKRTRTLAGAASAGHDLVTVHTRNVDGDRIMERAYGGDGAGLATTQPLCDLALGADSFRTDYAHSFGSLARSEPKGSGLSYLTLDLTIDPSTGLPSASKDTAALATDYEFDGLGRLTWAKPATGADAWTEYEYRRATTASNLAAVTIRQRQNGSKTGSVLHESQLVFDPFGRVAEDRRKMPGGVWATATTVTNAMGWTAKRSERMAGVPSEETLFSQFDPFGRPRRIEPPGWNDPGVDHHVGLSYTGARVVARTVRIATGRSGDTPVETAATTTERYDWLGRLVAVQEPSGAGGAQVTTSYGYDPAGRLTSVSTPSGVTQNRYFAYDGRGFLLSETHPEKGAGGNGTVHYSQYDARGHAGRRREGAVDGPVDLLLRYDRGERLTLIEERRQLGGAARRPLKSFAYGSSNAAADRSNGKLVSAVRHNWVLPPGGTGDVDVTVTETYTYGGRGGRVSRRDTAASTDQTFTQGWTYDDLGRVSRIEYPRCTFPQCSAADPAPARDVDLGYSEGLLTGVGGFTGTVPGQPAGIGVTYHPNGLLYQLQHGSGVTYVQENDLHSRRRPGAIRVENMLPPLPAEQSGPDPNEGFGELPGLNYAYDGAGNVVRLGDEWYLYDPVSRVVRGTLGTGDEQSYTFDAFGNIGSITTTVGGSTTPQTVVVDPQTNHLSGIPYDDAGNQLSWGAYAYTFDAFGMLERLDGGGNAWIYLYTADDERILSLDHTVSPWRERWVVRDLGGKLLRSYFTDSWIGGPWQWLEDYVFRDGQLISSVRSSEGTRHFHLDHLGSPRVVTGPDRRRVASRAYFPFGGQPNPATESERMKFTGHERDFNALDGLTDDLDYMHARYCSPVTGRFLSIDPDQATLIFEPQSWNLYSYAKNNPLAFHDPTGRNNRPAYQREVGQYLIERYPNDLHHGGRHYHVYKRNGRQLLGRVSDSGKVLTGKVPKSVLKFMRGAGLFGILISVIDADDANADDETGQGSTPSPYSVQDALDSILRLFGPRDPGSLSLEEWDDVMSELEAELRDQDREEDEGEDNDRERDCDNSDESEQACQ